jgi:formate hydrogenlyase subunit 6/NADH:ubiquinone oxidoreductase subunit I
MLAQLRFNLEILDSKCVGCAQCVEVCPIPCYAMDEKKNRAVVINVDGCIVCRSCEDVCPTDAVFVALEDRDWARLEKAKQSVSNFNLVK